MRRALDMSAGVAGSRPMRLDAVVARDVTSGARVALPGPGGVATADSRGGRAMRRVLGFDAGPAGFATAIVSGDSGLGVAVVAPDEATAVVSVAQDFGDAVAAQDLTGEDLP